jgi:pimeloyl-ACP methyl ester carboxylesterase
MIYAPLRVPRHEELSLRGLRHRLTWWGERSETPVVLLHGYLDCGATWQFLVDSLPPSWSLVALDWRGFGHSEWAPGGYWFPDYFADLEALLDVLVPHAQARVIGHSMGANIAKLYGGMRPKRLAWLANLEGLGLPRTEAQDAPVRYAQWLDELRQPSRRSRYSSAAQLAGVLRSRNPRLTPERAEFIARAWTRPTGHADPDGEVELLFDPRHRLVNPVLYRREEAEACWARFEAPMLLFTGEESGHRSEPAGYATGEEFRALFRNLRIVTVPGVGHMMHHEDPATLARHITELASEVASP